MTSPHAPDPSPPGAVAEAESTCHVLLVDDEPAIVRVGERILRHHGFRVTSATSAAAALEIVEDPTSDVTVVVTDLTMPAMNGSELATRIHAVRPDICVVLSTGYGAALSNEAANNAGFAGAIAKPFTPASLVACVRTVVAARPR